MTKIYSQAFGTWAEICLDKTWREMKNNHVVNFVCIKYFLNRSKPPSLDYISEKQTEVKRGEKMPESNWDIKFEFALKHHSWGSFTVAFSRFVTLLIVLRVYVNVKSFAERQPLAQYLYTQQCEAICESWCWKINYCTGPRQIIPSFGHIHLKITWPSSLLLWCPVK